MAVGGIRVLSSVLATMVWSLWVNLGSSSLHGHPFSVPPSYLRLLPLTETSFLFLEWKDSWLRAKVQIYLEPRPASPQLCGLHMWCMSLPKHARNNDSPVCINIFVRACSCIQAMAFLLACTFL